MTHRAMSWTNVTYREEIDRFVILARSGRFTVTELSAQFGISRKTGCFGQSRAGAAMFNGEPRRALSCGRIERPIKH